MSMCSPARHQQEVFVLAITVLARGNLCCTSKRQSVLHQQEAICVASARGILCCTGEGDAMLGITS